MLPATSELPGEDGERKEGREESKRISSSNPRKGPLFKGVMLKGEDNWLTLDTHSSYSPFHSSGFLH